MDKEAQKTLLDTVIEALPDHPEGNIWSDPEAEQELIRKFTEENL